MIREGLSCKVGVFKLEREYNNKESWDYWFIITTNLSQTKTLNLEPYVRPNF